MTGTATTEGTHDVTRTPGIQEPPEGSPLSEIPGTYARQCPDSIAVRAAGQELTWRDLHLGSNRVARGLIAEGARRGRIVSLLLPNSTDLILAVFACYKAGASPQVLNTRMTAHELTAILALADPAVVVTGPDATAPDVSAPVRTLAELGADGDTAHSTDDLEPRIATSWKAPVSGGSTGRPKIILAGREAVTSSFDAEGWGIDQGERSLLTAPLFHNAPLNIALTTLFRGGTVSLLSKFDPERTLAEIEDFGATWIYLVPTMMRRILALPEETRQAHDLGSLRSVWHCAEPCPHDVKQRWIDWLGAERIWELYAGTEAQAGCVIRGDDWLTHPGSVGQVRWGEVKLVAPDGTQVTAPGSVGEIYMRVGPGLPPAFHYLGAEDRQPDGWSSLGDMGEFDGDGFLYLHDRSTDMVTIGGANIYPAEVEAALVAHPGVLGAVVIGLPDEDVGNRLHAIINVDGPAAAVTDGELREFLATRVSKNKIPVSFERVTQALRDDAGKVRRPALRAERMGRGTVDGTA
jgi:bile acid-coenzyme A ligase